MAAVLEEEGEDLAILEEVAHLDNLLLEDPLLLIHLLTKHLQEEEYLVVED